MFQVLGRIVPAAALTVSLALLLTSPGPATADEPTCKYDPETEECCECFYDEQLEIRFCFAHELLGQFLECDMEEECPLDSDCPPPK
jgi:hypothetical protein